MNPGRQHAWLVILLIIGVLAALVFFTPLGMFVFIPIQMMKIHQVEKRMQQPEIYTEVATNMALYCQSVDALHITNYIGSARLPQPLPQLGSPWGMFYTNYAHVEFGGGFYHYGYGIQMDESASDSQTNIWELRFVSENRSSEKLLLRFGLPASARVPLDSFLKNSIAEYDLRLKKNPTDIQTHKSKINFLTHYDRTQLRAACLNAIDALPDHWWPRLTLALVDTGMSHYSEASSNLVKFVESKPSYSRFLYLAYFYQLVNRPDEAAGAVEKGLTLPIIDLDDDENNTESRGYSAGVYLYENGKYETVIKLCDALLPITTNGDYAKVPLLGLKSAARTALDGKKKDYIPSENMLLFDPYEKFDLTALLSK